jgi:hypothetical protein
MPIAIAGGAIDAIAFGLLAIAAGTLITAYVISPLRAASQQVSGLVAVGGALSWAFSHLADIVQIGLNANAYLIEVGRKQALDWFNWLIPWTARAFFGPELNAAGWLAANLGAVAWMRNYWDAYWAVVFGEVRPKVYAVANDVAGLHAFIDTALLPRVGGIGNDLLGLHQWIDGVLLPRVGGIGNDLLGLHEWIDGILVPGIEAGIRTLNDALQRTNADVQTRARTTEVEALRAELAKTQAVVGTLAALIPLALAGAEAISNLRCMMDLPCSDMSLLQDTDLEARVSNLELGEL